MKTHIVCAIAILGLLSGCAWTGNKVGVSKYKDQNVLTGGPLLGTTLAKLPEPVKTTLKEKAATAEISHIHKVNMSGKTVFKVKFLDSAKSSDLWIGEDGTQVSTTKAL
jgi:hypothetical protein